MNDLLACPFCGSGANVEPRADAARYVVICQNDDCNAAPIIVGKSKEDAIAKWNTRRGERQGAEIGRRDGFIKAALTGLAGCPRCHDNCEYDAARFARSAVEFADAAIVEADKSQESIARDLREARRRLSEIEELVNDQVDVDDGVPNLAARVQVIAKGQDLL